MSRKKILYDYECFSVFDKYYVFSSQSQEIISVKKETYKYFTEIKNGDISYSDIGNPKAKSFFSSLLNNNHLSAYKTHSAPNFKYNSNMLSLVHTQRCNLRCSYCFANTKTSEHDMLEETGVDAIDFFINNVFDKNATVRIDLTGAGEPLTNEKFIKTIVKHVKNLNNKSVSCAFITNGMLLNKKWRGYIEDNDIFWAISLDGSKEIHEEYRNGSNYDKIIENYKTLKLKTSWHHFGIRSTFHSKSYNIIEIFEDLYKVGYGSPISINPARLSENDPLSFDKTSLKDLLNSYDKFCLYLLNITLNLDLGRIDSFFQGQGYFRKFIKSILSHSRTIYRCSAGVQDFAVNYDGSIYYCTSLCNYKKAITGNIYSGIIIEKKEYVKTLFADNSSNCAKCWARYNCAGPCMVTSLMKNNTFGSTTDYICKLNKHLIKLAIYYCHNVLIQRPDLIKYIEEKYK